MCSEFNACQANERASKRERERERERGGIEREICYPDGYLSLDSPVVGRLLYLSRPDCAS